MKAAASPRVIAAGAMAALILILAGCARSPAGRAHRFEGESLVFIGEEPAALAHVPLRGGGVLVRSTYQPGPGSVEYVEGTDYTIDYSVGTLRRTPKSRILDFRTNLLYGQREFDHTKFPGFGNGGFFAFVDYTFKPAEPWPRQASQAHLLPATLKKLRAGGAVRIVAFGDSITAGGDATRPEWIFWKRWADDLQARYRGAQVVAINGATGGDSTVQGLQRLKEKVLDQRPDLVLLGFGMNDHNVSGVPIPQFESNLKEMIRRIRQETGAEALLFSAFPPNPQWKFGTHRMEQYAAATSRVAAETGCAYADVYSNWQALAARKKPEDLLGNNINHPNDFGHWIYFRVLQAALP